MIFIKMVRLIDIRSSLFHLLSLKFLLLVEVVQVAIFIVLVSASEV
jgi:hypothetical protein